MELPAELRSAVARLLDQTSLDTLRLASRQLTTRYRAEVRDGRLHVDDDHAARAYLAARLPATYAAVRASLGAASECLPDFSPRTLIDIGAGPGTAFFAAENCWPSLEKATLVEKSATMRRIGRDIAATATAIGVDWIDGDAEAELPALQSADLVCAAYLLDELAPDAIAPLAERLWSLTTGMLVIVEPGTPAGWQRILAVRGRLIEAGAHIVAPCPHRLSCPVTSPDWCHFSRRVARSRVHRQVKDADVPWEDEKYIFLAASRLEPPPIAARILAPPRQSSGLVRLKLCKADGALAEKTISRRDGPLFKTARRLGWGDAVPGDPESLE